MADTVITPPNAVEGTYIVYGRSNCPWCDKAIDHIQHHAPDVHIDYRSTAVPEHKAFLVNQGLKTVPQIWYGASYIGGYDKLVGASNG